MVLYLLTKFIIIRPWTNISWRRRFDLGFWQTSKQIYRKLQYRKKVFRKFQGLPRLSRKMFIYLLAKFGITKRRTNIRFRLLTDSQTNLKQNAIKGERFSELFRKVCLAYPRKWFCIRWPNLGYKALNQYSMTQKFDLGFWQTSKQIYWEPQYREKVFGEFQGFPRFLRKMVLYSSTKIGITKPWINIPWLIRFDLSFWQNSK